jgi:hypothetical protein|uniref:Uncharacterized protein n=1 Tax=uncultured prokaryote TaxID=198431 RepID=A0A0H5Q139_9ZZZZ|nr:hypothetical protein [uncultured prokaryote]
MSETVPQSAAEKKARQRASKRAAGFVEVCVWVAPERVDEVRAFAASLPGPKPPKTPGQMSLFE